MRGAVGPSQREQQLLDYLNEYGEATSRTISERMGLSKGVVNTHLRTLVSRREVSVREQVGTRGVVPYYMALTTTIASRSRSGVETYGFPVYRHIGTSGDRPIPNQGGQGAFGIRPRVSIELDIG